MNIKRLRIAKGLTQPELASKVGIGLRQLCNWEKYGLPSLHEKLEKLKKALS
jgi:transcriptional regulator with XRE-family HTH domain